MMPAINMAPVRSYPHLPSLCEAFFSRKAAKAPGTGKIDNLVPQLNPYHAH